MHEMAELRGRAQVNEPVRAGSKQLRFREIVRGRAFEQVGGNEGPVVIEKDTARVRCP